MRQHSMRFTSIEREIAQALIHASPAKDLLLAQLDRANVASREDTGAGMFSVLVVPDDCDPAPGVERLDSFDGVLSHAELARGVGAILWLSAGRLSNLELYSFEEPWPKDWERIEFASE